MTYELHPLCSLFPRLQGVEFDALCADIKANGQRELIVIHEGKILDGGNRYRACLEVGVEPQFDEFTGKSAVAFLLSANLHRRHLTPGQQAMIVSIAQDWSKAQAHGGDRRSDQAVTLPLDQTQDTVSSRQAQSGASDKTQRMADAVAKANPELAKAVAHGEISLVKASAQVNGKPKPSGKSKAESQEEEKPAAKGKPKAKQEEEKPKTEEEQNREDAFGDFNALQELDIANKQIEELQALVKAAEADDYKAETLKWRRAYDNAVRQQSDAMDRAKQSTDREAWVMKQLRRCGKAIGQEDPTKIAAAVEAFVLERRRAVA